MASTRLSDLIEPSVFEGYVSRETTTKSRLFMSTIIVDDARVAELAKGEGRTFNMPHFSPLDDTEANTGSDDETSNATPAKVTSGSQIGTKFYRNKGWSSADLAGQVAGDDPLRHVGDRVAAYWRRQFQKTVVSVVKGVIADNEANDSGDMVKNIANDSASTIADAERISGDAVIDAVMTLGDSWEMVTGMAVHSAVFTRMQKQQLITFVEPSDANVRIPQFMGRTVLVDDGMPAVQGTNRITYTSAFFGAGAFVFGSGSPKTPVEVQRKPEGGDGQGIEELWYRREHIIHPVGFKFTATPSKLSPTNTECEAATAWDRVYDRKAIPMAFLKTNG